jgi:hypothetical protein
MLSTSTIIGDKDATPRSDAAVLAAYFRLPNQSSQAFLSELKALSPEDKRELALGAAREMGWAVTDAPGV